MQHDEGKLNMSHVPPPAVSPPPATTKRITTRSFSRPNLKLKNTKHDSLQNTLPLRRRPRIRPHLVHPPPTRRPPQNPRPTTIQTNRIPSRNNPHNPLLSKPDPQPMARHTPLCTPNGIRICAVFHFIERITTGSCATRAGGDTS